MTNQQAHLCQLMTKLKDLCEDVQADYYLVGHQLLFAHRKNGIHGYEMDIAMFFEDWQRVRRKISDSNEYEVESLMDGGHLPGYYYRFVDKNSLFLDVDWYGKYAKPGVALNIHIIRKPGKNAAKLARIERGLQEITLGKDSSAAQALRKEIRERGIRTFSADLEKLLVSASAKKGGKGIVLIKEPFGKPCYIRNSDFADMVTVSFQGLRLYTMRGRAKYLVQRYGSLIKRRKEPKIEKQTYRCVFSEDLPYARYMRVIEEQELITEDFSRKAREYGVRFEKFQRMGKKEREGWEKTLFTAGERYRLWKKYMPQKGAICGYYKAGKYDRVELMLRDYLMTLERYLNYDVVICFDKELLDIAEDIYRRNGRDDVADKIRKKVNPEDIKPIEVTW